MPWPSWMGFPTSSTPAASTATCSAASALLLTGTLTPTNSSLNTGRPSSFHSQDVTMFAIPTMVLSTQSSSTISTPTTWTNFIGILRPVFDVDRAISFLLGLFLLIILTPSSLQFLSRDAHVSQEWSSLSTHIFNVVSEVLKHITTFLFCLNACSLFLFLVTWYEIVSVGCFCIYSCRSLHTIDTTCLKWRIPGDVRLYFLTQHEWSLMAPLMSWNCIGYEKITPVTFRLLSSVFGSNNQRRRRRILEPQQWYSCLLRNDSLQPSPNKSACPSCSLISLCSTRGPELNRQ